MIQPELFELTEEEAERLEQAADLLADPDVKHKWPQSLAGMMDVLASAHRADGMNPDQAMRLAAKGIVALARYHGGRQFYLPTNDALDLAVRDRMLFDRWMRGLATPEQLADEIDTTYTRVMQIIAAQRSLWRKRHDPELPGI